MMPKRRFGRPICLPLAGVLLVALVASGPGVSLAEVDIERGAALYENHCGDCHSQSVHRREDRRVQSRDELRTWVIAWSAHAGLDWAAAEVEDVTSYLSTRLYDFSRSGTQ